MIGTFGYHCFHNVGLEQVPEWRFLQPPPDPINDPLQTLEVRTVSLTPSKGSGPPIATKPA